MIVFFCEKRLPWSNIVFKKEVIFHWNILIWVRDLRIRFWGLKIKHLIAHNIMWMFFLLLLSRNNQLSLNFHRFVRYVEIHQVRRLVFDNYQLLSSGFEAMDPFGICQRPVSWRGVSRHMQKNINPWKFWSRFVIQVARNNERKNIFVAQISMCFRMPEKDFRPEIFFKFKYFSEKLTSFSKTMLLRRESVPTMFYTIINSSPLPSKCLY